MNSKSQLVHLQEGMMGKLTADLQLKLLVGILQRQSNRILQYFIKFVLSR